MLDFDMLGLSPTLQAAVKAAGYDTPTPIQNQAIPLALEGHDIMGLAQTGTGKTAAFGLPLVEHLMKMEGRPQPKCVKALVLAPTRELVNQIAEALNLYVKGSKLRVGTVVGGQSINTQIRFLSRGIDILVATPGRLIDLMDRGAVRLDTARFLVLDEADQMLDLGFIHALRKIAPKLGRPRQTMLFSATMPKQMEEIASTYLRNPRRVQVSPPGKAADKITQSIHFLDKGEKVSKLKELLLRHPESLSLVFARTKHGAERLMKQLVADGFDAASIHGNKSQGQRDRAIKGFREGSIKILVATDVAARGIDIPDVRVVYNFDLPDVPDNYVHRIGRTARAGRDGEAVAFCSAEEVGQLKDIEKVMKVSIPVASGDRPEPVKADKPKRGGGGGRGRRPQGGGGGQGMSQGKPRQQRRNKQRRRSAA
ncbi:DEAD/DEAH box helicase [Nioella sp.]|uniref:DEAD/DEAH box helicase n=1 Tax=Nioella sp. TaxID=1912091 RepID=UPI003517529D